MHGVSLDTDFHAGHLLGNALRNSRECTPRAARFSSEGSGRGTVAAEAAAGPLGVLGKVLN